MKALRTLTILLTFSLALASRASSGEKGATSAPAAAASPASAMEASVDLEKAIAQLERDWMDAIQKKDAAALERLIADDATLVDSDGRSLTKAAHIAEVKSGDIKIESFTLDPVKVRVFGDIAIATSDDTEKSQFKGKDSSGHYIWTDIYIKRNGRWQAIAAQNARLPQPKA